MAHSPRRANSSAAISSSRRRISTRRSALPAAFPVLARGQSKSARSWSWPDFRRKSKQKLPAKFTKRPVQSIALSTDTKERWMSRVRVLVGTRKGAFILTSDGKRERWDVSGPHFGGWELYHLKGSPADPNRLYASQSSGWFGQLIQRSNDGGKTWHQPGTPPGERTTPEGMPKAESNKFIYDTSPETGKPLTTHQFYDGKQHPWEFKRVWHLEPSLTDPDTVYAGVEDAALFRSTDGGKSWRELAGLRGHGTGPMWQPGAGGMCLHTIVLDPGNPQRIFVAISAAGAFRSDDAGKTWRPITRGLKSPFIPD